MGAEKGKDELLAPDVFVLQRLLTLIELWHVHLEDTFGVCFEFVEYALCDDFLGTR